MSDQASASGSPSGSVLFGSAQKPPLAPKTPPAGPSSPALKVSPVSATPPVPQAVDVPLIEPRFPRRARGYKEIRSTSGGAALSEGSASDTLSWKSRETLTVRCGHREFQEPLDFHTYALFKNGRQVHARSVGYSSDGDLVLQREESTRVAGRRSPTFGGSGSESTTPQLRPISVAVTGSVCLNPQAKPPRAHTDSELPSNGVSQYYKRRKYPGVKCPKNRKTRNRLMNDHMATAAGRRVYDAAKEDDEALEELTLPTPMFPNAIPSVYEHLVDCSERQQSEFLQLLRLNNNAASLRPGDKDSANHRFQQLSQRLKGELSHAMTTDYMPTFLSELDEKFSKLISEAKESDDAPSHVDIQCRDGYGRLMTHGVAAYYKLISESRTLDNGERVTRVQLPKPAKKAKDNRCTLGLPSMPLFKFLSSARARSPSPGADDEVPLPPPSSPPKPVSSPPLKLASAEKKKPQQRSNSEQPPEGNSPLEQNPRGEVDGQGRQKRFKKKTRLNFSFK